MVYWLMANPNAGEKDNRGAEFWRNYLESAGIVDIRDCSLDDKSWTEEVGPPGTSSSRLEAMAQ